jgi:hypothetical protein
VPQQHYRGSGAVGCLKLSGLRFILATNANSAGERMGQDSATLRTNLTNHVLNGGAEGVAGIGRVVTLELVFDGVAFNAEELFDAIGRQYGVQASLTTALTGANNDLTFTSRGRGNIRNLITVAYVDPAANNAALAVSTVGNAISVSLATGGGGAITSTAAQVRDAVNADSAASALVFAANAAANDGTGVVTAMAATALAGGDSKVTSDVDTAAGGRYRWRVKA